MSGNKVLISFYTNGNSDYIRSRFKIHFTGKLLWINLICFYIVTVLLEINEKKYDLVQPWFAICFAECGGLLSGFSGTIASLWNTPDIISEEKCAWEINAPGGKSFYLRSNENFTHLCIDSLKVHVYYTENGFSSRKLLIQWKGKKNFH